MPRLAGSTLRASRLPLARSLAEVAAAGFRHVDLAVYEGWTELCPSRLRDRGPALIAEVRSALAAESLEPVALNVGVGSDETQRLELFEAALELAVALDVSVVTVQAAPTGTPRRAAVDSIRLLVDAARKHGVTVAVETHVDRVTEKADDAVALVEQVEGLELTLDPSHFAVRSRAVEDALLPHTCHLHYRDARPGELQVWPGDGVVDPGRILDRLSACWYSGDVSVEYIDDTSALRAARALVEDAIAVRF